MPIVHFLNVKEGDCSIIQHGSRRISVTDVYNARNPNESTTALEKAFWTLRMEKAAGSGNFNQKAYSVNPIEYMRDFGYQGVFRFILTGPDMDHMDGIEDFFGQFPPENFWDTANTKELTSWNGSPYREKDWKFYKNLRDTNPKSGPSGTIRSSFLGCWKRQPTSSRLVRIAASAFGFPYRLSASSRSSPRACGCPYSFAAGRPGRLDLRAPREVKCTFSAAVTLRRSG